MINGKILCDVAHPSIVPEVIQEPEYISQILKHLADNSQSLVHYLDKLELNKAVCSDEAKELLRIRTMKLWKAVRCFKLAAFTSDVMLEMIQLPVYTGDEKWTHAISDEWPIGVLLRDSPVVETLTIGLVVILGLLYSSAPIAKILLTPDVFYVRRAVELLIEFEEKHISHESKENKAENPVR